LRVKIPFLSRVSQLEDTSGSQFISVEQSRALLVAIQLRSGSKWHCYFIVLIGLALLEDQFNFGFVSHILKLKHLPLLSLFQLQVPGSGIQNSFIKFLRFQ